MAYCRKCGAKLEEDARFCHVCGAPVVPMTAATRPAAPKRRRPVYILPVVILVAVLLTAIVVSALFFLPFYPVHFNQANQVPKANVNSLTVDFQADVAHVNVFFKNLPSNMVLLNVTADGNVGILDDPNHAINVTFDHQTANNSAIVIASVSRTARWPILYNLNVTCDIYIDSSANLNLTVRSGVGNILMNVDTNVIFQDLNLETTTGSIDISLSKDVTIDSSVSLKTTTGSVHFRMDKAEVSDNISVNLQSTTGSVNMDLTENQKLSGNVTVNARTTTGSVNLSMVIDDDVGASIESQTVIGGINVDVEKFSGNQTLLQSDNYPAGSNFLVNLRTSTGGINISAVYAASTVLS
jgi:predicted membrane protein